MERLLANRHWLSKGDSILSRAGIPSRPLTASATLREQVIARPWKVNNIVAGTNFPKVPDEMIHNIIYENWKRALPEYIP